MSGKGKVLHKVYDNRIEEVMEIVSENSKYVTSTSNLKQISINLSYYVTQETK